MKERTPGLLVCMAAMVVLAGCYERQSPVLDAAVMADGDAGDRADAAEQPGGSVRADAGADAGDRGDGGRRDGGKRDDGGDTDAMADDAGSTPEGGGAPDAAVDAGATVALELSHTQLAFEGVNGAPIATQSVTLSSGAQALAWTASVDASWIELGATSGTTPSELDVSVEPSHGPLASGTHTGLITLTAVHDGTPLTAVIEVSLVLTPPVLTLEPSELTLSGSRESEDWNERAVSIQLNTGANTYPWTAAVEGSWLTVAPASGSASSSPATATVDAHTGAPEGGAPMQITFSATVNGDTVSAVLPVRLKRAVHRLIASDDGIALTSVPGISLLSATVIVRDNLGVDSAWSAEADEPWLQVTGSGRAGDELVLTADPTGLSANTLHYARVQLSTNDASVEHADVIRVGLWIGTDAPAVESRIMHGFTALVADPIRPYVYVHDGGGAISIYHVYTAELVGTVPDVAAALGSMAISTDGSRLFAYDGIEVVPIDLDLLSLGASFPIDASASVLLAYGRLNGGKLLFSGNGRVHDVETGAPLELQFDAGYYGNNIVAVSQDGSHLCALDSGLSPYSISCYALEYDEVAGRLSTVGGGSTSGHHTPIVASNGQDVALNADGTRAYVASGAPYLFYVFDTATMDVVQELPGTHYPNNAEVSDDGRIAVGSSVWYDPIDVWIYAADGTELDDHRVGSYARAMRPRQLKFSGDGARIAALTEEPSLVLAGIALPD